MELMELLLLAAQCAPAVHPQTMEAVIATESNLTPIAINVNGVLPSKQPHPKNTEEAIEIASKLIAEGKSVDLGLGQINSANLPKLNLTVRQVFDPCTNLHATQEILRANYRVATKEMGEGEAALIAALSAYNTGSQTKGIKNGYVAKVQANAGYEVPAINGPLLSVEASEKKLPGWDVYKQQNQNGWDVYHTTSIVK